MDPHIRYIFDVWAQATPEEQEHGRNWYTVANAFARGLAEHHGLNITQTAGIIAALSPQLSWARNMTTARQVCKGERPSGVLGPNVTKAFRIRKGEHPGIVLGGPKVRAFYSCIMGGPSAVVVDRHALSITLGRVCTQTEHKKIGGTKSYDGIAELYRLAADQLGTLPHVVQATTWCTWRRLLDDQGARGFRRG